MTGHLTHHSAQRPIGARRKAQERQRALVVASLLCSRRQDDAKPRRWA